MNVFFMVLQIILGLSIIVIIHEFGHYITARAFGMYVEKFFLFFDAGGKKLFSITRNGTEYGVGWLPLGGYVKISGMIDESMDTEQMKSEPQPWEFRSKPAWQRLIVMVAGVVLNFILGILIFAFVIFGYGEQYTPIKSLDNGVMAMQLGKKAGFNDGDLPVKVNGKKLESFRDIYGKQIFQKNYRITVNRDGKDTTIYVPSEVGNRIAEEGQRAFLLPRDTFVVDSVKPETPADSMGLKNGDVFMAVNGIPAFYFNEFNNLVDTLKGERASFTIRRNGETLTLEARISKEGTLGFYPDIYANIETETRYYNFPNSVERGVEKAYNTLTTNLLGFWKLISGQLNPQKAMQGPIGIATIYGSDIQWVRFWEITGLLSIVIGLVNILPIPALDGGHAMLLTYEIIFRKPVPDKVYQVIQMIGIVIILSLMVFVIVNDIFKLVY